MKQDIISNSEMKITAKAIESTSLKLLPQNSILMVVRSGILQRTLPVAITDVETTINQDLKAIVLDEEIFVPEYFFHMLKGLEEYILASCRKAVATVDSIEIPYFLNLPIPVPPLSEQHAIIASIKDRTDRVNNFLSQKQRFIDLLREQKQAIINEAVTKGIHRQNNDNHPAKQGDYHYSDDAPWLGGVPGHWEVRRLKDLIIGKLKYGANESGEETNPNYPRYIRITDFDSDGSLKADTFRSLPPEISSEYPLTEGDILFARSGATVGKTFQFKNYNGTACFAGYLIRATPNIDLILSDFLYYYTNSNAFENWKNSIFSKATIENIGADKYNVLPVPVPPLAEQAEIVAHIERESERIDTLMNTAKKQVAYMQEYRQAMVAESVTGGLSGQKRVYQNAQEVGL